MEHGLSPFGRVNLHSRRYPLDRQSGFVPEPDSDGHLLRNAVLAQPAVNAHPAGPMFRRCEIPAKAAPWAFDIEDRTSKQRQRKAP
jgi:hypothetical protein